MSGKRKNVLALMYHLPPLGGIPVMRSLRMLKYLGQFGWDLEVVTSKYGYDLISGNDEVLVAKIPKEVQLVRITDPMGRMYEGVKQRLGKFTALQLERIAKLFWYPDDKLLWGWLAVRDVRKRLSNSPRPDIIYASGFPWTSFWAGARLKKFYQVPLVFDFRDCWSINPSPFWSKNKIHKFLESRIIRRADLIVFTAEGARQRYQSLYPDLGAKMVTINNGFDPEDFDANSVQIRTEPSLPQKQVTIVYAGSLSDATKIKERSQSLVPFIEGVVQTKKQQPALFKRLKIEIHSNDLPNTRKLTHELGVSRVFHFHPRIPHKQVLRKFAEADILLLILMKGRAAEAIVPAKLYEYIAVGKPVLSIAPEFSAAAKIIKQYDLGVSVDYSQIPDAIPKAINDLMEKFPQARNGKSESAKTAFNGSHLIGRFADAFQALVTK